LSFAILERDFGLAGNGFAEAVAVGDNVRRFEIEEIEYGEIESEDAVGIAARGKLDVGVGCARARPLYIEGGFDLVPVLAGVLTAGINLLEVAVRETLEAEGLAESEPIGFMGEVGVFDQGNGDAFAGKSTLPERQQIVDGREVIGADGIEGLSLILDVEVRMKVRLPLVGRGVIRNGTELNGVRLGEKIVQRSDAFDGGRERGGDLRIAHVGDVFFAVRQNQVVDLGVERFTNLRGGSGEVDHQAIQVDAIDRKAVRFEPALDGCAILRGKTEALAQLPRSQPVVEFGGIPMVHGIDQLLEARFGFGRGLEGEK
jgi:hypothetical protein